MNATKQHVTRTVKRSPRYPGWLIEEEVNHQGHKTWWMTHPDAPMFGIIVWPLAGDRYEAEILTKSADGGWDPANNQFSGQPGECCREVMRRAQYIRSQADLARARRLTGR